MDKNHTGLRDFYLLWSTQSLSQLGSAMTSFALTLWLYEKTGSALSTAALTICTYSPYVLMSIFAGAVTDRFDKKKTMLACDTFAAICTVLILVAYTLVIPKEQYQRTSGLQSLSRSVISVGNPLIAAAVYGIAGLGAVIMLDLASFAIAFVALACFIRIPAVRAGAESGEKLLTLVKGGLHFLKTNPLVLHVILFMSGVNLISSAFNAVLPALVIPRSGNGVLGIVTSCSGIAMIFGSLLVTIMRKPRDRVKVIYRTMLFSLGIENYLLAFSRSPVLWCIGQLLGWTLVPVMSANLTVIMRNSIPVELQGRVYACRNTLQFFTIPIGLALGGFLVDEVCEPFMAVQAADALPVLLFGTGKGSGAALMMFVLGAAGTSFCLISGRKLKQYKYTEG